MPRIVVSGGSSYRGGLGSSFSLAHPARGFVLAFAATVLYRVLVRVDVLNALI
jgi:hypothetical protein